jgi:Putative endonuclease segE, GIY-YIG domain
MWLYNNEIFNDPGEFTSFVYLITNLKTDKKYIGKKTFYFSKSKIVKGKRKKFKVESDWKEYFGSSDNLLEELNKYGKESFRREILRLCKSKGEASYFEAKEQFDRDVLFSDLYYNSHIMVRVHKRHLTLKK